MKKRLFIFALDGTPFTLLQELMDLGLMPNLKQLVEGSLFKQMNSVQPPVSSSAWASFMTGKLPEQHGILGFVDRDPVSGNWYLPNATHLRSDTIWQVLSKKHKRVFSMNVPVTYPPREINGISICGFLGSDISKGTWPAILGPVLKARGYRIDADTELAKTDLDLFLEDLQQVFERRMETMWHFYKQESWDIFMTHVMETDRLHHFLWEYFVQGHIRYRPKFLDFYNRIDREIGKISSALNEDSALMLLSDHGFCTLKYAVYLNRWLADKGFLQFTTKNPQTTQDIHPSSQAFSLYPGRIYFHSQAIGTSGKAYDTLSNDLIFELQDLKDPQGNAVIRQVLRREEVYPQAKAASLNMLPDLLALPYDGYDIKGNIWSTSLFDKTIFNGMHTFDNAFVLARDIQIPEGKFGIEALYQPVLDYFEAKN